MQLFEQIYRTNRIYWHGSTKDFDQFAGRQTFLSTDKRFSMVFIKPIYKLHLYMCKLTRPLNLFNLASEPDFKKMYDYLAKTNQEMASNFKGIRDEMVSHPERWRHWKDMERDHLLGAYRFLKYDGYTTSEELNSDYDDGKLRENIAVFNPENIKILKHYTYEDLEKEIVTFI